MVVGDLLILGGYGLSVNATFNNNSAVRLKDIILKLSCFNRSYIEYLIVTESYQHGK
jgi:hypothetical protein